MVANSGVMRGFLPSTHHRMLNETNQTNKIHLFFVETLLSNLWKNSARLNSALFTGVLGNVHNAELKNAEFFKALKITLLIQKHPSRFSKSFKNSVFA